MLEIKKSEFNPQKYNKLNLLTKHKNGNETYEYECNCDRCEGLGKAISHINNGRPVFYAQDNGVCYKCWGSGKMVQKLRVVADENWTEKVQKRNPTREEVLANMEKKRQELINKHTVEGFKKVDFTTAKWFTSAIIFASDNRYYRVVRETEKAICVSFINTLDDCVYSEYWFPKSAIIKNN